MIGAIVVFLIAYVFIATEWVDKTIAALVGAGAGAVFAQGGDIDVYIIFEPRILAPIVGLAALAMIPMIYKKWKSDRRRFDGKQ